MQARQRRTIVAAMISDSRLLRPDERDLEVEIEAAAGRGRPGKTSGPCAAAGEANEPPQVGLARLAPFQEPKSDSPGIGERRAEMPGHSSFENPGRFKSYSTPIGWKPRSHPAVDERRPVAGCRKLQNHRNATLSALPAHRAGYCVELASAERQQASELIAVPRPVAIRAGASGRDSLDRTRFKCSRCVTILTLHCDRA
jgi:hypothetical protein